MRTFIASEYFSSCNGLGTTDINKRRLELLENVSKISKVMGKVEISRNKLVVKINIGRILTTD